MSRQENIALLAAILWPTVAGRPEDQHLAQAVSLAERIFDEAGKRVQKNETAARLDS